MATVLPRLMNFLLVPLHTDTLPTTEYSDNTTFYISAAFFNVLLTYGMETSFFRFFSKSQEKSKVYSTVLISLVLTTILFFTVLYFNSETIAHWANFDPYYLQMLIWLLLLDTLAVAPFAYLRATGKPVRFTVIKLSNLAVYFVLNYFFLWFIPRFNLQFTWYDSNNLVQYIFMANLAASALTLLMLLPHFKVKLQFSTVLVKQMLAYGWPIMVAGLAYVINENFDKWLLPDMLGKDINGAYSGCYKIAVFMTIFIQGFRLGAEPFFFSHADNKNAKQTYATIMKYFVIFGSLMMVFIVAYLDFFKRLIVRDPSYWIAIDIVPVVLLANLFFGMYFNLAVWYKLTDKTRYGMYISVFGAIITIIFNYTMIPKIGFMASAWATLVAYGSMMVISYILSRKYYKVPYNVPRIALYLSLTVILSVVLYTTQLKGNYYASTGLLLLFLGIVVLFEKNELKRLVKRQRI